MVICGVMWKMFFVLFRNADMIVSIHFQNQKAYTIFLYRVTPSFKNIQKDSLGKNNIHTRFAV